MNGTAAEIQLPRFLLAYLLLLVVLFIMKKAKIDQQKLLLVASFRMTLQLVIAGFVLTYLFENPRPLWTALYLLLMIGFAIVRVLGQNRDLNRRFQAVIAASLALSGLLVTLFLIVLVVGESPFNPQYMIPISGMIIGSMMTAVSLAVRAFRASLDGQRDKIVTLLNVGAKPEQILLPFVQQSVETAMLPTLNSMLGMGIVALPGMMTGQMLSGTLPTTAILYQIAIILALAAAGSLGSFCSLYFGYRTLWNARNQIEV